MKIVAAADGSALGNPGPAGWGWYVDRDHWACGGWPHGTNNMGELMAVLDLLQATAHLDAELHILCDSKYVIDSVTKWMPGWKRNGWKKKDKKPVLNLELMQAIDAAMQGRRVTFEWVKGHAGHVLNEQADRLANGAATSYQRGAVPTPGPGYGTERAGTSEVATGGAQQPTAPSRAATKPATTEDEFDLFSTLSEDEIASSSTLPVQPRDLTPVEAVIEAERALLGNGLRSNPDAVAELLHPAWHEIDVAGQVRSRAEMLVSLAPLREQFGFELVQAEQVDLDTVLVVWRAVGERTDTIKSSLWVRSQGRWLQRFQQSTREV